MIKLSSGFMMLARDSIRLLNVTRGGSAALFNKSSVWNPISNNFMVASFSSSNSLSITKEWTQTLTRAEKVVGYPTSILNLRYMVMDEMANFANLFRKMMKTKHPLVSLVHDLLLNGVENESKRTLQINGIIVLLIAKAAGIPSGNSNLLQSDISEGILNSQRSLAEITEMIYIGSLIHRGIVNLAATGESMEHKQMDQGNKLAVLCGDYLLASACNNLSKLKNPQVVGLISEVIADISQSKFSHDHEESKTAFLKQWYEKINSTTSILLSNSAKSALLLVSHSPKLQETAWHFAKHLNLAHKVWSDLVDLKHENKLENDHQETILYAIYKDRYSSGQQDVKKVLMSSTTTSTATTVDSSTSLDATSQIELINDCKLVFTEHYHLAMSSLKELENEHSEREALGSLRSILNVMKDTI